MRTIRYAINVSLDGCVDHRAFTPDEEVHRYFADLLEQADALLLGRVTYQLMEEAWRRPASGEWPDWIDDDLLPFARTIDAARKHVVSTTLEEVDWNAELVEGDVTAAVRALKAQAGGELHVGGVALPLTLAGAGLIDEYELVVHPVVAGHGPTLFAGLPDPLELELVGRREFRSGVVALRYRPVGSPS